MTTSTLTGKREQTRRKLLDTARALFYEHGIRATGVSQIAAQAGVTKMTLYQHFASKEELIVAGLREEDAVWMGWLEDARTWAGPDTVRRLLSMFDLLEITPLHGRLLTPSDAEAGAPPVVVMGHALWARRYESDPELPGKTIRIGFRDQEGLPEARAGQPPGSEPR